MFAKLMHHLNVGAQKKIVLGPAGWFQNAASLDAMVARSLVPLSLSRVSFLATHVAHWSPSTSTSSVTPVVGELAARALRTLLNLSQPTRALRVRSTSPTDAGDGDTEG